MIPPGEGSLSVVPYSPLLPRLPRKSIYEGFRCLYSASTPYSNTRYASAPTATFKSVDFYAQLPSDNFASLFPSLSCLASTYLYKRVDRKVLPVPATLLERFRIQRIGLRSTLYHPLYHYRSIHRSSYRMEGLPRSE